MLFQKIRQYYANSNLTYHDFNRIFDAAAEARAIDDCIYHLKNSFNADNLDINVFIKVNLILLKVI